MPEKKFELGDYVEVKDRLKLFYELYGKGSIVTEEVTLTTEPDGKPRVMVRAAAYRTADDPHPGIGYSWLEVPGKTPYTNGSEVENAETSAWGRAIASLGILVDRSIASAQEVENKRGGASTNGLKSAPASSVVHTEGGLIGVASIGKAAPVDGQMRQEPAGTWAVGFVIGEGNEKVQCVAHLSEGRAAAFELVIPTLVGKRVQVFGPTTDETMRVGKIDKPFLRCHLERLVTPDETIDFAAPEDDAGPPPPDELGPEPPAELLLFGEKVSA